MQHLCLPPVLLKTHKLPMLRETWRPWAPAPGSSDTRTNRSFPERGPDGPVLNLSWEISAQGDHKQLVAENSNGGKSVRDCRSLGKARSYSRGKDRKKLEMKPKLIKRKKEKR